MKYKDILSITINGKQNTIRVTKNVIKILGLPDYVCLRVNNDYSSFAILSCSSKDLLSFKVPKDFITNPRGDFRIYSKRFIRSVFSGKGLRNDSSYLFYGYYLEKNNAVIFNVSEAKYLEQ